MLSPNVSCVLLSLTMCVTICVLDVFLRGSVNNAFRIRYSTNSLFDNGKASFLIGKLFLPPTEGFTRDVQRNGEMIQKKSSIANDKNRVKKNIASKKCANCPDEKTAFTIMIPNSEKGHCDDCPVIQSEKRTLYQHYLASLPEEKIASISIVSTCTENRLPFLPFLLERWPGEIVLVLQIPQPALSRAESTIRNYSLPSRVVVVLLPVDLLSKHYLVNRLRNIGIQAIRTSHFVVLDIDMWPNPNLYSELMALPEEILQSNTSAVVIPAVFISKELVLPHCSEILDCALETMKYAPKSKNELRMCRYKRQCSHRKESAVQHRYVTDEWYELKQSYVEMKCFKNNLQEPYIMLKYDKKMLLYDERFVDYGCNKVQYIDHIRHLGYHFFILGNSFAVDIVHHDSSYRKAYLMYARANMSPRMRVVCNAYLGEVERLYGNQTTVAICDSLYLV